MGRWVKHVRMNDIDKPRLGENWRYIFIAPEVSGGNGTIHHFDPTNNKRIKTRDYDPAVQLMFPDEFHNFRYCLQVKQFYGLNLNIEDALYRQG